MDSFFIRVRYRGGGKPWKIPPNARSPPPKILATIVINICISEYGTIRLLSVCVCDTSIDFLCEDFYLEVS